MPAGLREGVGGLLV